MQRLFAVSCNKHCKDSMSELLAMTFADYAAFEVMLRIRSMHDEEIEFNKFQLQKR